MMMEDVDYIRWADYIEDRFCHYDILPKNIADLACGTGNMTIILSQRGYNVIGIDRSEDMLSVAQEKAREQGLKIPFICQDLRQVSLHKKVDAVLIVCDGINYILDDSDLISFSVYIVIKTNVLLFDISIQIILYGNSTMIDNIRIYPLYGKMTLMTSGHMLWNLPSCTRRLVIPRFDEIHVKKPTVCDIAELEQNKFIDINSYIWALIGPR